MDLQHLALLRLHDNCTGLSDAEIDLIASKAEVVHAEAGVMIHRANQKVAGLFLVGAGRLRLTHQTPDGTQKTLRYIGAGDQFGALLLITDNDFPVNVQVDEKSLLFRFDPEIIDELVNDMPVFRRNILRKIGFGVKDTLLKQRKRLPSKVVAFINVNPAARSVVSKIANRLISIGEKVAILGDSKESTFDSGIPYKTIRDLEGGVLPVEIVRKIARAWMDMDRILVVVDRFEPADKLVRLMELSDTVFCMAPASDPHPAMLELKKLIANSPSWKKKLHFVWVFGDDEKVVPRVPELGNYVERDFKVDSLKSGNASRLITQGVERIVHYLRGVSVGIALSGGGAHGMTHLGVLKALEEAGITLDRMAGTSAGVLTGVIYCAGYSPDWGIEHFTKDLQPNAFLKRFPMGDSFYMIKQYRFKSWEKMLRRYLNDWSMEQFPLPVSTVTTDLVSASSIVRESGDAVNSILESINIPVISKPICRDGMLLVDGGVLNNLPADVLVRQGCNFVMGIDVSANIEQRVGVNSPNTPTLAMRAPGAVATLMRCLEVQAHNMSSIGSQAADVTIAPDVSKFDATAFTETPAMAKIGYQATVESLPKIRKYLNHIDPDLFPV